MKRNRLLEVKNYSSYNTHELSYEIDFSGLGIFNLRYGSNMIEKCPLGTKLDPRGENICSLKHTSHDTKPPTWCGEIRGMIQANYNTKHLPRDENTRASIHTIYEINRLIAAIIFKLRCARAACMDLSTTGNSLKTSGESLTAFSISLTQHAPIFLTQIAPISVGSRISVGSVQIRQRNSDKSHAVFGIFVAQTTPTSHCRLGSPG